MGQPDPNALLSCRASREPARLISGLATCRGSGTSLATQEQTHRVCRNHTGDIHAASVSNACYCPARPGGCSPARRRRRKDVFKVAWSIYVGWMPWDYAQQSGILKKWADKYGIKIELTQINDYVESINQYTAGKYDACVMTNMDMLTIPAAGGVDSTALIVGDYSNGNDGVVLKGAGKKLADIKGQSVNLVELSVSHYLLARGAGHRGPAGARHQGGQHLGRRHRRRLRHAGRDRDGDLEAAAVRSDCHARALRWCSIPARFPARSST